MPALMLLAAVGSAFGQTNLAAFDSWSPPPGGVFKLKDRLNGSFTAKGIAGTPLVTTTNTPWRVLLQGFDIYGNRITYVLDSGSIPPLAGSTNAGDVETLEIPFSGSITNDGTLHNFNGDTNTSALPPGYTLTLCFGPASPTSPGAINASTNGFLVTVVPDLLIPPVQQIYKSQAGARAELATNANGSVRIASIVITNPGSGYNLAAPPSFTFTPQGGSATNAAVVLTNSVIVDPETGSLLSAAVNTNNSYASTVTNVLVGIAPAPVFQTQRTGGVLYGLNPTNGLYNYSWNPGDAVRFQTTIANNLVGEVGLQSRPMRPVAADLFRLSTTLTIDPIYSGEAGSDDLFIFEQDCSGDLSGLPDPLTEVRAVKAYNTPGPVPEYGITLTNPPASATAVITAGRVTSYTVNSNSAAYSPLNPPAVTIVGDGFGATAQAVVSSSNTISAIVPVSFGQGYTTATVQIAAPKYGARYYQPRPDDGYLDIGEQVEIAYDVLMPWNATGIYFVGAKVDSLNNIAEPLNTVTAGSVYKESPPLQTNGLANNNTFISDVATRLQIVSVPAPRIDIVSQVTAANGAPIVQSDSDSDVASVDSSGSYVVFESSATDLAVPQAEATALYGTSLNNTPPLWGLTNTAATNGSSVDISITNGVSNGLRQIFRRNTADFSVETVSVSSGGAIASRDARNACVSTNGEQIAFESAAPNLVDNDTGGSSDIFVRRMDNFRTVRVSVNSSGTQGNAGSVTPSISDDGRYVAFASQATNLDDSSPKATGTSRQAIFVHDRDTDEDGLLDEAGNIATYAVSVNKSGELADGWCDSPKISGDGSCVVFVSYSGNMPESLSKGYQGLVYRVKLIKGKPDNSTVSLASIGNSNDLPASVSQNGSIPALSYEPVVNRDGTQVAFTSFGNNLVAGDENGFADVFVRDFLRGKTVRVSEGNDRLAIGHIAFPNPLAALLPQVPAANNPGVGDQIVLSDGTKTVAFTFGFAVGTNTSTSYGVLIGGNASQTRSNLAAAINTANAAGDLGIRAFPDSPANSDLFYNLSPPGQANIPGLYLISTTAGAQGNVPISVPGITNTPSYNGVTAGTMPSGAAIQYSGMEYGGSEALVDAGESDGVPAGSTMPSIDASGNVIAFRSTMVTLDSYDRSLNGLNGLAKGEIIKSQLNYSANIYVRNRDEAGNGIPDIPGNTSTKRISVNRFGNPTRKTLGEPSSANNHKPSISASGRYIAFSSDSDNRGGLAFAPRSNRTPQDTNQKRDVFLYDRATIADPPAIDSNNAPAVTLTEPVWLSGARLAVGSKITINALVSDPDPDDEIDTVFFYVNGKEVEAKRVDDKPNSSYLTYGDYYSAEVTILNKSESNTILARATDKPKTGKSKKGTSFPITFATVDSIPMPISVTMLPLPRGTILETGQPVKLEARVALPALAYYWDVAVVRFYANGILIGSSPTLSSTTSPNAIADIIWYPPLAKNDVKLSAVASTVYGFGSTLITDVSATLYSAPLPAVDILGVDYSVLPGSPQSQVTTVFDWLLSRPPDGVQNQYWVDAVASGTTQSDMVMQLIYEDEYTALQNKLLGYYYTMGVSPVKTTYLQRLGLMTASAGLTGTEAPALVPAAGYPTVNDFDAPYGVTTGDASAAQLIIGSAAFASAHPGVQNKTRKDFLTWYFSLWPQGQLGPANELLAQMNAYVPSTEPRGYAASFINGLYSAYAYGPYSAYDYQLKATSLLWLYTGNWEAPTDPPVTTYDELRNFVETKIFGGPGTPIAASAPQLSATTALPVFSTAQGTPSSAQTILVSGQNLTGKITVTAPLGFQVSLDNSSFAESVQLAASATSQPVYTRVSALASAGSLKGAARVTADGALSREVALEADVSGNPFLPVSDTYLCAFGEGVLDPAFATKNGMVSIATKVDGSFAGTLFLNGSKQKFAGKFDSSKKALVNVVAKGQTVAVLNLDFDTQMPTHKIVGTLTIGDSMSAVVALPRGYTGSIGSVHPKSGKQYSVALPKPSTEFVNGFASVVISANGSASINGQLGDGTAFTAVSAAVDGDVDGIEGYWILPVYAAPYGKGSCLTGEIYIAKDEASANPDVTGNLAWVRPPTSAKPSGIRCGLSPVGQAYAMVPNTSLLSGDWNPAAFALIVDRGRLVLPSTLGQFGSWPSSNVPALNASASTGLSLAFSGASGQFSGRLSAPSASRKAMPYRGVMFSQPLDLPGSLPVRGIGIMQSPKGAVDVEITE